MLLYVCLTRVPKRVAIIYLNSFIGLVFLLEIQGGSNVGTQYCIYCIQCTYFWPILYIERSVRWEITAKT